MTDKKAIKKYGEIALAKPAWAKGSIIYFDIFFMIYPSVQICAFICLRKLKKGYSYMLGPRVVADTLATG